MAITYKVIVTGEGGVGRTTALFRYTEGRFSAETKMTLGVQFFSKTVEVEGETFKLSIFDLAGQERWRFLFEGKIALGVKGAILFFDLTRPMTLENLSQWVDILRQFDPNLPILFVGTKTDLDNDIMVDDSYAMYFKEKYHLFDYIKISNKTGENVELIFENLIRKMAGMELLPTPIINVDPIPVRTRRYETKRYKSKITKTYKINEFITLKLKNNKTHIYVKSKDFIQCKYLLLNIPVEKITDFDAINSIDEASEILDKSLEYKSIMEFDISPEAEFWGHCSNLQAWAENGYDTRLLHRNLAFPLLRRLTEVGDTIAKRAFKDEIALRFENGNLTVQTYLIEEGYLGFLVEEELRSLLDGVPNKEQILGLI